MTETVVKTEKGAILYDKSVISRIREDRFRPNGWLHAEPVGGRAGSGGRGNTMYVGNVPRQFVLRHYQRGGLARRLVRDRYVFAGEDRTRSFAEWRLLAKLADKGLRVPRPAAARYTRRGSFYRADIITVRIPGVTALSELVLGGRRDADFWRGLGAAVRGFHAHGVYHADMNAHNLQIDEDGRLWMLDFDRGRLMPPGQWQQRTLNRLHRSLQKVRVSTPGAHFTPVDWERFVEGYFDASRSA